LLRVRGSLGGFWLNIIGLRVGVWEVLRVSLWMAVFIRLLLFLQAFLYLPYVPIPAYFLIRVDAGTVPKSNQSPAEPDYPGTQRNTLTPQFHSPMVPGT
jgi:hypothetical protein